VKKKDNWIPLEGFFCPHFEPRMKKREYHLSFVEELRRKKQHNLLTDVLNGGQDIHSLEKEALVSLQS
jgi:hypothetical protein